MGPPPFGDGSVRHRQRPGDGFRASMGPPPFGDGSPAPPPGGRPTGCSFNGATAFRRWKPMAPNAVCHQSYSFNGATAFRRWKRGTGATGGCCKWSFNGATAFRRWKLGAEECHGQQSSSRFNGATAFRRWKPWSWARSVSPLIWLQWGHRLSAMEARASSESILPPQTLQWGHRLSAMEALELGPFRVAVDLASMGPPPFGDGSQGVVGVHLAAPDASMGPPPFGDGSPPTPPVPSLAAPGFNGATAFRRWKLGQGRYPQRRRDAASMGPPPFGDGSRRTNDAVTGFFDRLQWGHRLSAMEAAGTGESKTWMGLLQWGHRLSAMEACWDARTPTWAGSRFNGATAFRRWKHRRAAQRCRPFGLASMGPPPFGDGSNDGSDIKKAGIWLQWGHRLSAMEALVVHGPHHELPQASMGPPPFGDGSGAFQAFDDSHLRASMGPPPFGDGSPRL